MSDESTYQLDIPRAGPYADRRAVPGQRLAGHSSGSSRRALIDTARCFVGAVRGHYASSRARVGLVVLSVVFTYGGGLVMFWFHAIYRGEQGPPIANQWHWLVDSSLGFLALTPVLLVLLPMGRRLAAGRSPKLEAVIVGGLFAIVTTAGPLMHYHVVAEEAPLARLATAVFGRDPNVVASQLHSVEHSLASSSLLQLVVGLPVYILLAYLTAAALSRLRRGSESRPVRGIEADGTVLIQAA